MVAKSRVVVVHDHRRLLWAHPCILHVKIKVTSCAYAHSIRFGRFHISRSNWFECILNADLLKPLLEVVSSGFKVDF